MPEFTKAQLDEARAFASSATAGGSKGSKRRAPQRASDLRVAPSREPYGPVQGGHQAGAATRSRTANPPAGRWGDLTTAAEYTSNLSARAENVRPAAFGGQVVNNVSGLSEKSMNPAVVGGISVNQPTAMSQSSTVPPHLGKKEAVIPLTSQLGESRPRTAQLNAPPVHSMFREQSESAGNIQFSSRSARLAASATTAHTSSTPTTAPGRYENKTPEQGISPHPNQRPVERVSDPFAGRELIVSNMTPNDPSRPFIPSHLAQPSALDCILQISKQTKIRYEDLTSNGVSIPAAPRTTMRTATTTGPAPALAPVSAPAHAPFQTREIPAQATPFPVTESYHEDLNNWFREAVENVNRGSLGGQVQANQLALAGISKASQAHNTQVPMNHSVDSDVETTDTPTGRGSHYQSIKTRVLNDSYWASAPQNRLGGGSRAIPIKVPPVADPYRGSSTEEHPVVATSILKNGPVAKERRVGSHALLIKLPQALVDSHQGATTENSLAIAASPLQEPQIPVEQTFDGIKWTSPERYSVIKHSIQRRLPQHLRQPNVNESTSHGSSSPNLSQPKGTTIYLMDGVSKSAYSVNAQPFVPTKNEKMLKDSRWAPQDF